MKTPWLKIVGIGEDGWEALTPAARSAIAQAAILYGGTRHLAHIPPEATAATRTPWPSPMAEAIEKILTQHRNQQQIAVLASGDPMLYGVGVTLTRSLSPDEFVVIPGVSAFALACARLGWPAAEITLISLVARPLEQLHRALAPNQRLILYSEDGTTPAKAAAFFTAAGYGPSLFHVFENLGGPTEHRTSAPASAFPTEPFGNLNLIAVQCEPAPDTQLLSLVPGLPNEAFQTDGQLTKREVRAATLARLAPLPGQHLWDVGAGTGTIAVEWLRTHPTNTAIAFEEKHTRAANIRANAAHLGTPSLQTIEGQAPATFATQTQSPDAIFIGGGLTIPGLFEACWHHLRPGGRLVANAVTLESEALLITLQARHGGDLTRLQIAHAEPLGPTQIWRQGMPITQWTATKP
ncbi:bifunctional cobalt-precorrin-7 (C(5))-methyltransferase/cobalt-precorrin-6B (C(15))-methyltransferase [Granulicella tundricola]|uniref:Precorrin-6y C5,15-methyltransferase (Decarboxylating), CbiE subunit n=1 Tax=Granulicella tundricola (strain ATCC BAA-1859 / DSM 23138 / MP5ACTX9) TaxID=1198114 RepID=E8X6S4_GRATM|nr:bifunctional cobalt-precorrin-7 (C(5))-methyltransferase/cobalt-precorrin-6B (C(15))-methyltransferase [Granulicella tundricola]ADW71224.1 precorrin-6y C5,15-methyltransferase (decarboxylating), CbiE subunit [Granulicella tundricola MP5ACTX9]